MYSLKRVLGSKWFQLAISILLLTLLSFSIDLVSFWQQAKQAEPVYLWLALLLVTGNRLLMPIKWNLLLRAKGHHLSWWHAIKVYYVSTFFGLFLPATVGADALRTYYTRRHGIELHDGLASIIVERILGLITLLVFGFVGCLLLIFYFTSARFDTAHLSLLVLVLFAVVLGGFGFTLNNRFGRWVTRVEAYFSQRNRVTKPVAMMAKLYRAYAEYRSYRLAMFGFFLLTCVETTLPIIWSYFVGLSLGVQNVPLVYYFAFIPVTLLAIRLPISLDGFGVNEATYVYFLALVGVSTTLGFAIGFISHVLFIVGLLPGALFYLLQKNRYQELIAKAEPAVK